MKTIKRFLAYWIEPSGIIGVYIVVRLYKALTGNVKGLIEDLCHLPTRAYGWYHEVEYEKKQKAMRGLTLKYALGEVDVNEYQKLKKKFGNENSRELVKHKFSFVLRRNGGKIQNE